MDRQEANTHRKHRAGRNPFMEFPFVMLGILFINLAAFLILSMTGSTMDSPFMAAHGTLVPGLVSQGEYYRLVTAFFLHFGISHLFNNMLLLGYLGGKLEKNVGHLPFLLLYFAAGLAGNLVSWLYYLPMEPYANCAGASGAVFGIVGAFICLVIKNRGQLEGIQARQLLLMILFTLYNGVVDAGINNIAHVTGLVTGFLLALFLPGKRKQTEEPVWREGD